MGATLESLFHESIKYPRMIFGVILTTTNITTSVYSDTNVATT